jgi:hypothetical protein
MAGIDEEIVREYFEQNGFLVRQISKYQAQTKRKSGDEEIDFVVYNPAAAAGSTPPDFILFPNALKDLRSAVVSVVAWHTERITPARIRGSPEMFAFLDETVLREAARFFPEAAMQVPGDIRRILILPGLPATEPHRGDAVRLLQEKGVDNVISFRSILLDLAEHIEVNRNYRKSDVLQMIRLFKTYDLLSDGQMELLLRVDPGSAGRRR